MQNGKNGRTLPRYRHDALTRQQLRQVAAAGGIDEKTVVKYLRIRDGEEESMHSTTESRVESGLRDAGFEHLIIVHPHHDPSPRSSSRKG